MNPSVGSIWRSGGSDELQPGVVTNGEAVGATKPEFPNHMILIVAL